MTTQTFAHQVIDFNKRVLKIEQRPLAPLSKPEFDITINCLNEEVTEFGDEHKAGNFIGSVDGIIDMMYFGVGALYKMGLTADTINKCMTAVHEANMEKKLGVNARRGDGSAADAVKPEGWIPPEERIADILDAQAVEFTLPECDVVA